MFLYHVLPPYGIGFFCLLVNGGTLVTPHFGVYATDETGKRTKTFSYEEKENAIDKETSEIHGSQLHCFYIFLFMHDRRCLSRKIHTCFLKPGHKGQVEGYRVGGKTATSEKLPRGNGKYISSFLGFAPAEENISDITGAAIVPP